ncbi:DUF1330 domain-containing protein [Embleya sp. NPDC005575]|uniref:DUF1330 domain-containing protein n=1 Tax=Embleya sp. NPDC005575 TaxID=3156892 RepID=UPI0033B55CD9
MPAYVIVDAAVLDEDVAREYQAAAAESVRLHGGRYLVRDGTPHAQEGIWASSRLIVIEFPDLAHITRWYESAEYRRAREIRKTALPLRMLFAEGTAE